MRAVVTGAGRLGVQVAGALAAAGNEVTVIEIDDEIVERLRGDLRCQVLRGDACDPAVLEEAGALRADVVVATTGDDEDNLVISLLAKRQFSVPRVVARVNDADNRWLFGERWGVDVAVSASSTLMSLIEEATGSPDTIRLVNLARAGVNLIETTITGHSRAGGRTLAELRLPPGAIVAAVVRGGVPNVPGGSFRLEVGDEVLVVSESATEADVQRVFQE